MHCSTLRQTLIQTGVRVCVRIGETLWESAAHYNTHCNTLQQYISRLKTNSRQQNAVLFSYSHTLNAHLVSQTQLASTLSHTLHTLHIHSHMLCHDLLCLRKCRAPLLLSHPQRPPTLTHSTLSYSHTHTPLPPHTHPPSLT